RGAGVGQDGVVANGGEGNGADAVPLVTRQRRAGKIARRAEHSSQTPHANRLLIAADRYISEWDRIDILADRLLNSVRYQELRPEFLVEALDSGGQIHRVADHGVFLAPRRADAACHHVPKMQSYADTQRPITADIVLLDRGKHFARGRDGAPRRVG